jgi:hypothetical protein
MRQRLVLVVSSARVFASGTRDWTVCYELRSISSRDEYIDIGLLATTRDA